MDNSVREPSVLVSELHDYLNKYHSLNPVAVEHPLQPFSKVLFDPSKPALHSFASEWAPPVATPPSVSLHESGKATLEVSQLSLEDFQAFWRNPSNWYCRRVLGIALWRDEQEPEDAEPFELDALSRYALRSELLRAMVQQPELEKLETYNLFLQSGSLPHGGLGELGFETSLAEAKEPAQKVLSYQATAPVNRDIDIQVGGQQLQGRLAGVTVWPDGRSGLLHYHASDLKGSQLVPLWLLHLVGSAAGVVTGQSVLVAKNDSRDLPAVSAEDALAKLKPWFEGWNIGQSQALPFFPKTSAVIAGAIKGDAVKAWQGSQFPGESDEEAVQLLYGSAASVPGRDDVISWSNTLLGELEPLQ